jgi:hypothetical protein
MIRQRHVRIIEIVVTSLFASTLLLCGLAIADNDTTRRSLSAVTVESPQAGEQINWQVISSGGTDGSSASFGLRATVGQTATGSGSSENYGVDQGYWQDFGGGPDYICGDADGSGGDPPVDIDDVVYLINYIFSGGPAPDPIEAGNPDCSTADPTVDIDDVVWLIAYIFSSGNAPCDTDGDEVPDC